MWRGESRKWSWESFEFKMEIAIDSGELERAGRIIMETGVEWGQVKGQKTGVEKRKARENRCAGEQ